MTYTPTVRENIVYYILPKMAIWNRGRPLGNLGMDNIASGIEEGMLDVIAEG